MARIVSIGAALQDVYLVDHDDFGTNSRGFFNQLELGTKVDIDKIQFSTGGGASNAATTFARNGHESIFMGCISNDPAGTAIINSFDDEGIDSSYVTYTDRAQTGYSVLLLAPSGERTILTCRGASAKFDLLNPDDLDTIHPDWVYVTTFRGNMDMLDQFFTKAKSLGAKIMFNPGNLELQYRRKLLGLLSDVDVLLVNKKESKMIVEGTSLTELIGRLRNYVPAAIITDSNQGAIATDQNEVYRIGIYEDVRVKDSTGAGDAFGSGFLAAYANGKSFKDSLIFASANSTSVVQKIGSKAGIINQNTKLHTMPIQEIR
ncbi:MAG: carbohydrate kinase family protein [Candidatus Saccharibacteria bacterium]|nr:carbohydrate kinase family protein [Candidatus Saccharibacteria bacterium]